MVIQGSTRGTLGWRYWSDALGNHTHQSYHVLGKSWTPLSANPFQMYCNLLKWPYKYYCKVIRWFYNVFSIELEWIIVEINKNDNKWYTTYRRWDWDKGLWVWKWTCSTIHWDSALIDGNCIERSEMSEMGKMSVVNL